jgi:hypothetical protein
MEPDAARGALPRRLDALLIYVDPAVAARTTPEAASAELAEYDAVTALMRNQRVFEGGEACMPASMTTTVTRVDEQVQVVSSGRTEGLELSGFYIVNVANVDDATAWAARLPSTSMVSSPAGSISRKPPQRGPAPARRSSGAQDLEDEILPTIRELGIGLVPYSPLGRGMLTGRLRLESLEEGDCRRTGYFPRFQDGALEANLALVAKVQELAEANGATPGQLALAWVLAQGDDIVPIPGTKRVAYLEENVGALALHLTDDDLKVLEQAVPRGAVVGDRYADMSHIDA